MDIRVVKDEIGLEDLKKLADETFGDMVKAVVDIEQGIMAVGGELHADAEAVLLEQGSKQSSLWGINIYPAKTGEEFIEYKSLINIRPRQGSTDIEIHDHTLQEKIKKVIENLIKI